jgi:hypothetical protein
MAIDINIGSKLDGKGFKQADTAINKLNKGTKNLARNFGLALGTAAILAFGKASVKAFAEDDKAAAALGTTLKNLNLAYGSNIGTVNGFISRLELQTGVLDDELRPAMDRLLRATGDVTKSQELLGLALDIAAGTGKSVTQVSQSLQKAYLGQNQALGRLGVGLSKAELTSSSFEEIQQRLSVLFAGQATAAADTYAGSLARLTVAGNNAKETIGKGLIDALTTASNSTSTDDLIEKIDRAAESIANFVRETGEFIRITKSLFDFKNMSFFAPSGGLFDKGKGFGNISLSKSSQDTQKADNAAAKAAANQIKATNALTKSTKENLKLTKAKAIFDLQKIQIEAALKGKLSEEDRIRLKLMQAIENENIGQIEKYTKLLDDAQKNTEKLVSTLASIKPLDDVFKNWNFMGVKEQLASLQSYFNGFAGSAASAFNALNQQQQAALGGYKPFVGASIPSVSATNPSMPSTVGLGASGTGNQVPAGVTINVNTGIGDPNAIAEAIENVLVEANYRGTLRGLIAV